MSEWIKCSERMPEERVEVLIFVGGNIRYPHHDIGWHVGSYGWSTGDSGYEYEDVTHWQPLPEPPSV